MKLKIGVAVLVAGLLAWRMLPRACVNIALLGELKLLFQPGAYRPNTVSDSLELRRCACVFQSQDHTQFFLPARLGVSMEPARRTGDPLAEYVLAHPEDFWARFALAEAHIDAGDIDAAFALLKAMTNAKGLYHLGHSAAASGRQNRALAYMTLAVRLEPRWAEVVFQLGENQYHLGDPAAMASYRRVLELTDRPQLAAAAHVRIGELLASRGNDLDAEAHFQTALALFPDSWSAMVQMGYLTLARGQADRACAWYQSAKTLAQESIWPQRLLEEINKVASCGA